MIEKIAMETVEICLKCDPELVSEGFAVQVACRDCGKAIMITKSNLLIHVQEKTHLMCFECARNYYKELGLLDKPLQDFMRTPTDGQLEDFSSISRLSPSDCSEVFKIPSVTIGKWIDDMIAGEDDVTAILKRLKNKED